MCRQLSAYNRPRDNRMLGSYTNQVTVPPSSDGRMTAGFWKEQTPGYGHDNNLLSAGARVGASS